MARDLLKAYLPAELDLLECQCRKISNSHEQAGSVPSSLPSLHGVGDPTADFFGALADCRHSVMPQGGPPSLDLPPGCIVPGDPRDPAGQGLGAEGQPGTEEASRKGNGVVLQSRGGHLQRGGCAVGLSAGRQLLGGYTDSCGVATTGLTLLTSSEVQEWPQPEAS